MSNFDQANSSSFSQLSEASNSTKKRTLQDLQSNANPATDFINDSTISTNLFSVEAKRILLKHLGSIVLEKKGPIDPVYGLTQGEVNAIRSAVALTKKEIASRSTND
ncbi:hypothetical protein C9374_009846 [Naegleria lovaniensis]|uniref:Uncharacterized protein n=1 Tax=Naegleria lovaniensis TaxID=51637 RepID=A0AA88GHY1_NAELO|nr:uncharacterized protein C9374_009846 [Naegleria lovaniensis]KAG2375223.1 hypothetical protein C9374_009846 [Naegleria lovaniensis]